LRVLWAGASHCRPLDQATPTAVSDEEAAASATPVRTQQAAVTINAS
jgi:hypothetical protein